MIKQQNRFLIILFIIFSIFIIPKDTFAKEINAFRFSITEENFIESNTLIRLKQVVSSNSGSTLNVDKSEWLVIKNDDNYEFYVTWGVYNAYDNPPIGPYNGGIALRSYVINDKYYLTFDYKAKYVISKDFEFISRSSQNNTGYSYSDFYHNTIYSADNYDDFKIDDSVFNENPDEAFSIDFPMVASNSNFLLMGLPETEQDITYKFISIQDKPNYLTTNSSKSLIILPFDEERNVLLTEDSYDNSKKWVFNSSEYTSVKIFYDVLEGTLLETQDKTDLKWWEKFLKFFGYNNIKQKSIDVDNFIYTVSSSLNFPKPQRFYSTNGDKYKKLPNDFNGVETNFYSKYVDTLNYNDGVRKGYILLDFSTLPPDTEITFEVEYSTISLDIKGIEKNEDIDSLTEFDFSNYYGVALIPKFDYLTSNFRFPIYYQGNLLFGSLYNDDIENLNKSSGWKATSVGSYSKFLFDLTEHKTAVEQGLNIDNPYLFIKNLNYGAVGNVAKIKYNESSFELLVYESPNITKTSSNGHNYWSPLWDEEDIDYGSVDSDGSTNGIGKPADSPDLFTFPTSLTGFLDMVPGLIKDLGSSFTFIGKMFTTALSSFPPIITYGLYSSFILGVILLIIKTLK